MQDDWFTNSKLRDALAARVNDYDWCCEWPLPGFGRSEKADVAGRAKASDRIVLIEKEWRDLQHIMF